MSDMNDADAEEGVNAAEAGEAAVGDVDEAAAAAAAADAELTGVARLLAMLDELEDRRTDAADEPFVTAVAEEVMVDARRVCSGDGDGRGGTTSAQKAAACS